MSRDSESPESASPSSPPTRFFVTSGRSGPGQRVVVHPVHLAEGRPHLPDLHEQLGRQGGEGQERLPRCRPRRARRSGRSRRARRGRPWPGRTPRPRASPERAAVSARAARRAEEVADDGDVGVEDLRAHRGAAVHGQRARGPARARGPDRDLRRGGGGGGPGGRRSGRPLQASSRASSAAMARRMSWTSSRSRATSSGSAGPWARAGPTTSENEPREGNDRHSHGIPLPDTDRRRSARERTGRLLRQRVRRAGSVRKRRSGRAEAPTPAWRTRSSPPRPGAGRTAAGFSGARGAGGLARQAWQCPGVRWWQAKS